MKDKNIFLSLFWSENVLDFDLVVEKLSPNYRLIGVHELLWDNGQIENNLTRLSLTLCGRKGFKFRKKDNCMLILLISEVLCNGNRKDNSYLGKCNNADNLYISEILKKYSGDISTIFESIDLREIRFVLAMLMGISLDDYVNKYTENRHNILTNKLYTMAGENSWDSLKQIFYILNETVEYVVLRNFHEILDDCVNPIHGDIDILVSNRDLVRNVLNAFPRSSAVYNVSHIVKVGNGEIYFDIRYLGDNYYCKSWEEHMLKYRYIDKGGFYRLCNEDHIYGLLYHALIQKEYISSDYKQIFYKKFPTVASFSNCREELFKILCKYLLEHNYDVCQPHDKDAGFFIECFSSLRRS